MKNSPPRPARSASAKTRRKQIYVALRIENNHYLAATDVLGDQQLRQARLSDARGAEDQCVPDAILKVHPDVGFIGFDAVDGRIPTDASDYFHWGA
jgi:hypothetical protein